MKKRYNLRDLDCANCAAKMENAIRRIDGVRDASVSFLTQKLTLEADEGRFRRHPARSRGRLPQNRTRLRHRGVTPILK